MLPSWFVFHLERLLDTLHILPQPLSLCSCISGRLNYQVLFLFAASLVVSNLIMWIQIPTSPPSCICISKQGRACHFENISNTSPRITSTGFQMKCSILLCLLAYLGCSWYTFPPTPRRHLEDAQEQQQPQKISQHGGEQCKSCDRVALASPACEPPHCGTRRGAARFHFICSQRITGTSCCMQLHLFSIWI